MASSLSTILGQSADSALAELGFGRPKKSALVYTRPLVEGVNAWLGLNCSVHARGALLSVLPIVGVQHLEVERLVARYYGEGWPVGGATVSRPIGYVMPQMKSTEWQFHRDRSMSEGVAGIVQAVADYGLPFMHSTVAPTRIVEHLRAGHGYYPDFRIPCALIVSGDVAPALSEARALLAKYSGIDQGYAEAATRFAEALIAEHSEPAGS